MFLNQTIGLRKGYVLLRRKVLLLVGGAGEALLLVGGAAQILVGGAGQG